MDPAIRAGAALRDRCSLVNRLPADAWHRRGGRSCSGGKSFPGGLVDDEEGPGEAALRELEDMTEYRASRVEEPITFSQLAETVDSDHVAFAGGDPERLRAAVAASDVERVRLGSVESVPGLIAEGRSGTAGRWCGC